VAREERAVRNLGAPAHPRRTNCEGQAGRLPQRQEVEAEGVNWESDRSTVAQGKALAPTCAKGATPEQRLKGNPGRTIDGFTWANLSVATAMRVLVKSPVRENCTPGSVRGAPGNRRPYLDLGCLAATGL
jgi:hypothetical protein